VVIVGGTFEIDPHERERFLASRHEMDAQFQGGARLPRVHLQCRSPRSEPGRAFRALDEPGRPRRYLSTLRAGPEWSRAVVAPETASIIIYDVIGERLLGD